MVASSRIVPAGLLCTGQSRAVNMRAVGAVTLTKNVVIESFFFFFAKKCSELSMDLPVLHS